MKQIRKYFLLFIQTLSTLLIEKCCFANDDVSYAWQGSLVVSQKIVAAEGSSTSGEETTKWVLNINWKEAKKNDVEDKAGKLVGQLIKLEDNGSSWSGTSIGGFVQTSQDIVYSGQGSGTNNTIVFGWIYYSLSDEDPLRDILPNGSYCFGACPSALATYKKIATTIDHRSGRTYSFELPTFLNYYVNGNRLSMLCGPISTEAIRECLTRSMPIMKNAQKANSWDTESRIVKDGKMEGSYSRTAMNGTLVNELVWDISRVINVRCFIDKADKNWRPMGGDARNTIKISATLNGNSELKGKWKFTLFEVSKEKGYAMNKGNSTDYDLKFVDNQVDYVKGSGEMTVESNKSMNGAEIEIESLDYGAWGKLKAEVNIEGKWYVAKTEDGKDCITIPYDTDEDRIADKWEEDYGIFKESEDADSDNKPEGVGSNKENGDGFTNYEEYRGFFINGEWKSTDPTYKDIFIYDELGLGVGRFTDLQLQVNLIDSNEFDSERYVNFNRGFGTLKLQNGQKGLYLCGETMLASEGRASVVGSPNVVDRVYIDAIGLTSKYSYDKNTKNIKGAARTNMFYDDLNALIAHELGHAVNLMHHGIDGVDRNMCNQADVSPDSVAVAGGKWSGDVKCVMRYNPPLNYLGWDGKFYDYPEDEGEASRTIFCDCKEGTGINAPPSRTSEDGKPYPVAGNATYGECKKNVTLKGNHYYGDEPQFQGLEKY